MIDIDKLSNFIVFYKGTNELYGIEYKDYSVKIYKTFNSFYRGFIQKWSSVSKFSYFYTIQEKELQYKYLLEHFDFAEIKNPQNTD